MVADQEQSWEALGAVAWAGEADTLQGRPSRLRASCPTQPFCPFPATPLRPGSPQSLALLAEWGLPWPGPRPPRPLSQILPCHPWGLGLLCPAVDEVASSGEPVSQGSGGEALVVLSLVQEEAKSIRVGHPELGGTELVQRGN